MKNAYLLLLLILIPFSGVAQNTAFITTWEVNNINGLNITIPTTGTGYDYTVDFGDSTVLNNQTGDVTHTYASSGIYTVTISGDFPRIYFLSSSMGMEEKIKSVEQWGDIQWQSMNYAFSDCKHLVINANDTPDLSQVTDMSGMFRGATYFNSGNLNSWDVSNVTNMSFMFLQTDSFNQNIDSWNVSNVTNMSSMFYLAENFNQPLNSWDVSSVTNMTNMFRGATNFNQPLGNWDVSSVENMGSMFDNAENFNQILNTWDVSNVTEMTFMFGNASSFDKALDNWDVSNVSDMFGMFNGAIAFNQPLNTWNVSNVTDMGIMFKNATSFNQPLNNWDVSSVTNMVNYNGFSPIVEGGGMFHNASSFNQSLNSWDVSNITNMYAMFYGATAFNQPLDNWDVSNVENMGSMFGNAISFNQDLSNWNFKQNILLENTYEDIGFLENSGLDVQNYDLLIAQFVALNLNDKELGADGLEYCDITSRNHLINTLNWTIDGDTFSSDCTNAFMTTWEVDNTNGLNITIPTNGTSYDYTINFGDGTVLTNQTGDTSHTYANPGNYTVSIVGDFPRIYFSNSDMEEKIKSVEQWGDIEWQSMSYAFLNCENLIVNATDAPDLSLVTDMSFIFSGCDNFNQSINHWDVSNVTNMEGMFSGVTSFNQALNTWDVSNVTDMSDMFHGANIFNQSLNSWNVSNVTNMDGMFEGAISFNQPLEDWDVSNVLDFSAMFFSASSFNQDLSSWQFNSNMDHLYETFGSSGLNVQNYDAVLQRFVQLGITNKTLGANGLFYCDEIAHNELSNILGWTIMGDHLDNNCNMAINSNTLASNIIIYPNPTNSKLNITSNFTLEKVTIYNLRGQVVISSNNNKETSIDLSSLPSGIYFAKITTNDMVETHKIIKK